MKLPYKYIPRWYQLPLLRAIDSGIKRAVWIVHRRGGKDKTGINIVAKKMFERKGIYYYFFPTFKQGRKVLWDGIDKDGFKFLDHIPKELRRRTDNQEMLIETINGSIFQIIGTDDVDRIMGTNPVGCVFSEYALQDPRAWKYISPILAENSGWAIFVYCVAGDTMILTENGFEEIGRNVESGFSDTNEQIYGKDGFHKATEYYSGGVQGLLKITTKRGYEIKCTKVHPLWTGKEWKPSAEWKIGDKIPIQRNQQVFGKGITLGSWIKPVGTKKKYKDIDIKIDNDLMYLLGLFLAEGNHNKYTATITNFDNDIIEFIKQYGFTDQKDGHYTLCSGVFCSFLDWFGIKHGAKNKDIPKKVFSLPKEQMSAFISGYFDGDGCSSKSSGGVKVTSASKRLLQQLQILLLNYGISGNILTHNTNPTKKVKIACVGYDLVIDCYSAFLFYDQIGFRLNRKHKNIDLLPNKEYWGDTVEIDKDLMCKYIKGMCESDLKRHTHIRYKTLKRLLKKKPDKELQKILDDNYYYDTVKSIENVSEKVYDFVIPDTHSFFSNGFISHNTPRQENHGWDLLCLAKDSPDVWFWQILTVEDTKAIPEDILTQERKECIARDGHDAFYLQEYMCSFKVPIIGSYYLAQILKAQKEKRFMSVPYEPQLPVDTWWDLGVGDSTAIWFTQSFGLEIRIIDYYENSGEGLPHYIKVLQDKKYIYGIHTAPHDIEVRELLTGKSRRETARGLGINFNVAAKLGLEDGIEAVRNIFNRCLFDEVKTKEGVKALSSYCKDWDEKNKCWKDKPRHDWSSHGSDAFRTFAVGFNDMAGSLEDAQNQYMKSLSQIKTKGY